MVKVILSIIILLFALFLAMPQEYYRVYDLVFHDSNKTKTQPVGEIDLTNSNEFIADISVERSGYYELGVILEPPHNKIPVIESEFDGPVTIFLLNDNDEIIVKEVLLKPLYFGGGNQMGYADKAALLTVPINTFKHGKVFKVKVSSENAFLREHQRSLYFNLSGYY